MPPRKSNISQISATDPDGAGNPPKERDGINIEVQPTSQFHIPFRPLLPGPPPPGKPQLIPFPHGTPNMVADSNIYEDLSLPKTMVQRLAKGVLPPNTSLGKDAIVAMQKGATVFINYLAQAANTSTTNANKRTIPPPAVLEALVDLEFDSFVPRVEAELKKYNEVQVGKRNEYRRKVKEEKSGGSGMKGEEGGSRIDDGTEGEEEEGRERKRVRREEGNGEGVNGDEGGREVGDGHEQLQIGEAYAEDGDEEFDGEQEEGADHREDDTANPSRGLRPRRSEEAEDDEDEQEEEEDDDDDDDEDEYPDEGRRLSSVEREAHEGGGARSPRYDDPMHEEEDEEGLSDVSD